MDNGHPSSSLIQFIEQARQVPAGEQPETVLDLRLAIRLLRLTEEGDWMMSELEQIEREAVRYGDQTELSKLVSGEATPAPNTDDVWLNSPSPFAWT